MGQQAFYGFISGPVLTIAAVLLGLRWLWGIARHIRNMADAAKRPERSSAGLLPLGRAMAARPAFVLLSYLLHIGLFILPFGVVEHSFAFFSLPTAGIGPIAMAVVLLILVSIIRAAVQSRANIYRYVMSLFAIVTMVSGCAMLYAPDVPGGVFVLHAVSAVILILTAASSVTVNYFDRRTCTGCAACHENCPTRAIDMKEVSEERILTLETGRCARCARCMAVCPENSVRLRHQFMSPLSLFGKSNIEVNRLAMVRCAKCGVMIAPRRQVESVEGMTHLASASICATCQEQALVDQVLAGELQKFA